MEDLSDVLLEVNAIGVLCLLLQLTDSSRLQEVIIGALANMASTGNSTLRSHLFSQTMQHILETFLFSTDNPILVQVLRFLEGMISSVDEEESLVRSVDGAGFASALSSEAVVNHLAFIAQNNCDDDIVCATLRLLEHVLYRAPRVMSTDLLLCLCNCFDPHGDGQVTDLVIDCFSQYASDDAGVAMIVENQDVHRRLALFVEHHRALSFSSLSDDTMAAADDVLRLIQAHGQVRPASQPEEEK
jgi:hypothetical protein